MEPIASFSGLASGVQWRDLVDQLMQVERRPATLLQQQITKNQSRSAAWLTFQNKLTTFQDAASKLADGSAFDGFSTAISGSGFKASATAAASPGSYSIEVLRLATAEKLGGDVVASRSEALGLSGELWVNGRRVAVDAGATLDDVAYAVNAVNTGSDASKVSASVVSANGGYQLVLTSQKTGAQGIQLAGDDGVLTGLGLTDGTSSVRHVTSNGAQSDGFASSTTAVATLLGATANTSGDVQIGSLTVTVDLGSGLGDIATAINDAAAAAKALDPNDPGANISASVVTDTVDGETVYRLDIDGTTAFTDANGVLSKLGVLEGGRGAVQQQITSGVALQDGGSPAQVTSLLTAVGGKVGETLTVTGVRPDGTTFSMNVEITDGNPPVKVGYSGVETVGDLLTLLREAGGFNGAATVELGADGRVVATDANGGASQLDLAIVANNESGGTLDFGAFDITTAGRAREIVNGQDAAVRVDGVYTTSSTNSIADAIPGVGVTLTGTTTEAGSITISRDTDATIDAVKALVNGYNSVAAFVSDQFTGGEGSNKPLSGDSTLRGIRNRLSEAMRGTLTTGAGGDWSRLGDLGVEIERDGRFSFDEAVMREALESDPTAVERLFGVHGQTTGSGLRYLSGSDDTVNGTYTVNIASHATTADHTGTGTLVGGYTGLTGDTLTITDLGTGKAYEVGVDNSLTSAQAVVDRINQVLAAARAHTISSAAALHADAVGTAADENTTWAEVHNADNTAAGVLASDTITISGRRTDGTSFIETLEIADPATQTLGELRDRIRNAIGTDASVEITGGKFVITAESEGSSLLELNLTAENEGGGTLQLATEVTADGRPAAGLQATLVGSDIRLTHEAYGSSSGFRVEYATGEAEPILGLGADGAEYRGTDVQGTIGGLAATGSGRTLTGADGTEIDGLMIRVEDTFTSGSVTFSRGIAALLERTIEPLLKTGPGSIQHIIASIDERVTGLNDRIDEVDLRLERRREDLIRRFTAMEQAMVVAQNQSSWLISQIGALPGSYSSRAE